MNPRNTAGLTSEPTVDELGARIIGLSARLAAANCRWLLMIAEFDRREGFLPAGLPSTSRWLSHHCGIAHRTAVEHVRVARALAGFPSLADEMAAGPLHASRLYLGARPGSASCRALDPRRTYGHGQPAPALRTPPSPAA